VLAGDLLEQAREAPVDDRSEHGRLVHGVEGGAQRALRDREAPEEVALEIGDAPVRIRHDPRGSALEDVELLGEGLDLRDELHARGTRAYHRDPFALKFVVVVPLRRVEHRPLEVVDPLDLGNRRLGQPSHSADQEVRRELAARRADAPDPLALVPGSLGHLMSEADVVDDAELMSAAVEVLADLRLLRVGARPVRVGRERVGVERRRDVALTARVRVVAPSSTEFVGALEHDEVVDPLLQQPCRHPDAGEPGADDRHARVTRAGSVRTHLGALGHGWRLPGRSFQGEIREFRGRPLRPRAM
jgi:hypothetical protein